MGSGELDLGDPELTVSIDLEEKQFDVGEPIDLVVSVENLGEEPVSIPRPSWASLEFFLRAPGSLEQRKTELVFSPRETADHLVVPGGESTRREFLLPLATASPGAYELFCIYRTEVVEGIESSLPVASGAVQFTVSDPAMFTRDSVGLISKNDAKRVAAEYFGREVTSDLAKLVRDSRTGFFVWWVTVRFQAEADQPGTGSCFVCAYRGGVRSETTKQVPADAEERGSGVIIPIEVGTGEEPTD